MNKTKICFQVSSIFRDSRKKSILENFQRIFPDFSLIIPREEKLPEFFRFSLFFHMRNSHEQKFRSNENRDSTNSIR